MKVYTFDYQPNNTEALHDRLKEVFGERYISMDSSSEGLVFRLADAQDNDRAAIRAELKAHKADERTRRQQKAADKPNAFKRLYELDFDAMRERVGDPAEVDPLLMDILNILEDLQKLLYEDRM